MIVNAHKSKSKSKLSEKEKTNGTSSAPFCDGKYNSKNNESSKDTTCGCQQKIETEQNC